MTLFTYNTVCRTHVYINILLLTVFFVSTSFPSTQPLSILRTISLTAFLSFLHSCWVINLSSSLALSLSRSLSLTIPLSHSPFSIFSFFYLSVCYLFAFFPSFRISVIVSHFRPLLDLIWFIIWFDTIFDNCDMIGCTHYY